MPATTSNRTRRTKSGAKRAPRSANRPNRAQIRAAEVRAAATPDAMEAVAAATGVASTPASRSRGQRPVPRVFSLSRDAELAYIRSDLRRLIYIAGVLFVLMISLLFILG